MQNNIFEAITFAGAVTLLFCYIYKTDFQTHNRKSAKKIAPAKLQKRRKHKKYYKSKPTNSHVFKNDYTDLHVEAMWDELSK